MTIAIGSDHGGLLLKEEIKKHLSQQGISVEDFGTYSEESVDYPDFAQKVSEAVISEKCKRGILVCGTGIGISIAANKVAGIRAALCSDSFSARMSREHNDANILCLGERVLGQGLALEIVDVWLKASFAGGRHENRVKKIHQIETKPF